MGNSLFQHNDDKDHQRENCPPRCQTSSSHISAHLSQDVSSARPPVDAGLAEPPLLLLHHQRLRPTRSSRKLHLRHNLNFFLESFVSRISVSTVSTFCQQLSRLDLSAVRRVPIGGCTALAPPRSSARLERSGQLGTGPEIRDNSIPKHHWWSKLPMTHHANVIIPIVINHMQQHRDS